MSTIAAGRAGADGGPACRADACGTKLLLYRNPLRLLVSAGLWRAVWYLAGVRVRDWLGAVRRELHRGGDRRGLRHYAGRHPAADRRGGGAAVVRRCRAGPAAPGAGRAGQWRLPLRHRDGPDRPGQGLLAGPGHLARYRLPDRALGAAVHPGHGRAHGLADVPRPGHAARLVLGAARQRRFRLHQPDHDPRRRARLLPARAERARRRRPVRRHAAQGPARRRDLRRGVPALQLRRGAHRAGARRGRALAAQHPGRPAGRGQGGTRQSRAARTTARQDPTAAAQPAIPAERCAPPASCSSRAGSRSDQPVTTPPCKERP